MRTPTFWYRPPEQPGLRARLLAPLGWLYAGLTARRVAQPAKLTPDVPVICVGNINAGGTGKTPTTIALVQALQALGATPHVVSRGHGGSLEGPEEVSARHSASDVGDEPLLLSAFTRTWIAKDRAAGVTAAMAAGASHILMDDGFQNPAVHKALSVVVVDAARGFGNGRCIPAGPLREPVKSGLARADLLLSLGNPADQQRFTKVWGQLIPDHLPHLTGSVEPLQMGYDFTGQRCLAFAGIGHPEKFFTTLKGLGADLVERIPLGDHQPLTPALMGRLEADAKRLGALLVTTEKDAVRLPSSFRQKVITLPVRLVFSEPSRIEAALTALT